MFRCHGLLRLGRKQSAVDMGSLLALAASVPPQGMLYDGVWGKVITPLRLRKWEESLSSYPDRMFAGYVCDGIRDGFRVGFSYCTSLCKKVVGNMKSVKEHKEVVEAYVGGERQAGRVLGSFSKESLQVSPFGVISKTEPGKWRLILYLTAKEGYSVNYGISKEICSLSYMSVDDVAARVVKMGEGL